MKKLGRFMEKKENMTKNKKLIYLIMCLIIVICILIAIVFLFKGISDKKESGNEISRITNHEDYTWEEFDDLTAAQQEAFRDTFNNDEDFEKWLKKAKGIVKESEGSNPWKKGDKQPKDYTWEEFNALTAAQQEAFRDTFNNDEDFEEWLLRVKD